MHFLIKDENYFDEIRSIGDKEALVIADLIKNSTIFTDIMLVFLFYHFSFPIFVLLYLHDLFTFLTVN